MCVLLDLIWRFQYNVWTFTLAETWDASKKQTHFGWNMKSAKNCQKTCKRRKRVLKMKCSWILNNLLRNYGKFQRVLINLQTYATFVHFFHLQFRKKLVLDRFPWGFSVSQIACSDAHLFCLQVISGSNS